MRSAISSHAFTIRELLIALGMIFVVLFVLVTPAGGPERAKAQRIKCINNLKNVALAERIFLNDNPGSGLGTNLLTAAEYFRTFSNELSTPKILTCPTDGRVKIARDFVTLSNSNLSYFVNPFAGTNLAAVFLAGDRNLETNGVPLASGSRLQVTTNLELRWTKEMHNEQGNIAMSDGSVQQFNWKRLHHALQTTASSSNLLLIP